MVNPAVCVLKTDGTNCDMEMSYAFEEVGGSPELVHINQLRSAEKRLTDYGVLAIPGGFSYGDDIASGKVLATELTSYLSDELQTFVDQDKPVFGVCNGFQVLVRTGLLPYGGVGIQGLTLANNEQGRFECRWVDLMVGQSVCRFIQPEDFVEYPLPMQVAHGEGRFLGREMEVLDLAENNQIVFQYTTPNLIQPDGIFPDNPNGSMLDIAGICDPCGTVLGMMPHPERSVDSFHPDRARTEDARTAANIIFSSIVNYAREV